jgi:uncharacterized membrane protein YjjP (DUF1212 family)
MWSSKKARILISYRIQHSQAHGVMLATAARRPRKLMNTPNAEQHRSDLHAGIQPDPAAVLNLVLTSAKLLFVNGQTTRTIVGVVEKLGDSLGVRAVVFPRWGELTVRIEDAVGSHSDTISVKPSGVDMKRVVATMDVVDQIRDQRMDATTARLALLTINQFQPVSLVRFALFAGAGAVALGVIFGATHLPTLVLIALSAGAGACLRRWLSAKSKNLFVQPFCAAFLAGTLGAIAVRLQLSSVLRLVAVCPCMVLVPGPHLLNGALDLARARIVLGSARICYASLVTLMICAGLVLGLALGGVSLPVSAPSNSVPLWWDVPAAGVAVAAYGTFFNMPWRMLPFPILIGMFAHACRWVAISLAGANAEIGALVACFVVGTIMTPIANRLRLPFAGVAFASVVSLIPGVFLFRMAAGMVDLVTLGSQVRSELFVQIVTDGTTALLIVLAMAFGLILPKMCIDHFTKALSPASDK